MRRVPALGAGRSEHVLAKLHVRPGSAPRSVRGSAERPTACKKWLPPARPAAASDTPGTSSRATRVHRPPDAFGSARLPDEDVTDPCVAGLGDGTKASSVSRGVLAGNGTDIGHELARAREAGHVAEFGGDDHGGLGLEPAGTTEAVDEGLGAGREGEVLDAGMQIVRVLEWTAGACSLRAQGRPGYRPPISPWSSAIVTAISRPTRNST